MNNFSTFQSQLFRGGVNINSFSYVNKYSYGITLDPSGTDYIELVDTGSNTVTNAYQINGNVDVSNTFLEVDFSNQLVKASDFLPNNTTDTTIYMKYKHNSASTSENVFSHLFSQLLYHIKITGTTFDSVHTIEPGQSFDVHYLVGGADTITYNISGVLDSVTLPTNGYLLNTYEKKTITMGSDASSGIIDFHVNDVLTNTHVYVPFRYEVNMVTLQDENTLEETTLIEIDGIAQKSIEQYPGIHYFDLSHSSMTGYTFALSQSPDNTLSGQSFGTGIHYTDVSSVGIPGNPGAYLRVITTINTPNLYYHGSTAGLGGSFVNFGSYDYVYTVKVVTNEVGKEVYAIDVNGDGVFYNQPDISFNGGSKYLFDVSDPTNSPYTLTFGTVVDGTGEESYISRSNGKVLLDLITYVGSEPFRYFEDSSAGMGYVDEQTEKVSLGNVASDFTNTSVLSGWFSGEIAAENTFTRDDQTDYSFANGEYSIHFSSYQEAANPEILNTTSTNDVNWHDYVYSDGVYTNTGETIDDITLRKAENNLVNGVTTTTDGTIYAGYYMVLTMPYSLIIKRIQMIGRDGFNANLPRKVYLCGSNDEGTSWQSNLDANWHFIAEVNFAKQTDLQDIQISGVTSGYKKIRFIVNEIETNLNVKYWGLTGDVQVLITVSVPNYTVTVSNEVFDLSGIPQQQIDFTAGETYVFDQSHESNADQQLVFGRTPDDLTRFTEGVTIMGSAGRDGAYTQIDLSDGFIGDLYYYSNVSSSMGMDWIVDANYTVKVQNNILDQPVWAFDLCGNGVFYNQPDLSFNSGSSYRFYVSDPSNNGYTMVFGTEVDNSGTVLTDSDKVIRSGTPGTTDAYVILDLRDYSGESLVYFEDISAGMGYSTYTPVPINYTHYYPMDTDHIQDSTYALYEFKTNTYDPSATIVNYDVTSEISNNQLYLPSTSSTTYAQKQFSSSKTTGTLSFWYTP